MTDFVHSTGCPPDSPTPLDAFFSAIFGESTGWLCVASRDSKTGAWRESALKYPTSLSRVVIWFDRLRFTHELFFSAMLFRTRKRLAENVSYTPCLWADLDDCHPKRLLLEPTFVLETSPDRYQAVWVIDPAPAPREADALSKAIAHAHKADGCDNTGGLAKCLRIPGSLNFKYPSRPEIRIVP